MEAKRIIPISEAEAAERIRFTEWMTLNFKYTRHPRDTMAVWEMFDLYKFTFPNSTWYEEDMTLLLYQMGYLTIDRPVLQVTPQMYNLSLLADRNFVGKLLQLDWDEEIEKQLRVIIQKAEKGESIDIVTIDGYKVDSLEAFYKLWCMDTNEGDIAKWLQPGFNKAIVGDVKRAYHVFCIVNKVPTKPWATVRSFLIGKGHTAATGYARRKSGQSYFARLVVPVGGELDYAEQMNQLIVELEDGYYLSNGTPIDIMDVEGVRALATRRLENLSILLGLTRNKITEDGGV